MNLDGILHYKYNYFSLVLIIRKFQPIFCSKFYVSLRMMDVDSTATTTSSELPEVTVSLLSGLITACLLPFAAEHSGKRHHEKLIFK